MLNIENEFFNSWEEQTLGRRLDLALVFSR